MSHRANGGLYLPLCLSLFLSFFPFLSFFDSLYLSFFPSCFLAFLSRLSVSFHVYLTLFLSVSVSLSPRPRSPPAQRHPRAAQVACHGGHTDCAAYLLSQRADVNKVDHFGRNSLWYASKCGGIECCELLLRHGAKLLSDNENRDAFHITLVEGHPSCAARWARTRSHDSPYDPPPMTRP